MFKRTNFGCCFDITECLCLYGDGCMPRFGACVFSCNGKGNKILYLTKMTCRWAAVYFRAHELKQSAIPSAPQSRDARPRNGTRT